MDPTIALPALPDTFFGWIPALYRVTEEQVLASAGLDAFVVCALYSCENDCKPAEHTDWF